MNDQAMKIFVIVCGVLVAIGIIASIVLIVLIVKTRRERLEEEEDDPTETDPTVFNYAAYNKLRKISQIAKGFSVFLGGILIITVMLAVITGCIYGFLSRPNSTFLAEGELDEEVVYRIYDLSAVVVVEDYEDLKNELNGILDDLRTNLFVLIALSILDYAGIRILLWVAGKYDKRIKKNLRVRLG